MMGTLAIKRGEAWKIGLVTWDICFLWGLNHVKIDKFTDIAIASSTSADDVGNVSLRR